MLAHRLEPAAQILAVRIGFTANPGRLGMTVCLERGGCRVDPAPDHGVGRQPVAIFLHILECPGGQEPALPAPRVGQILL